MPLRVHCPSGCFVRMPTNRAGKVVRCSECKRVIRLDSVSRSEIESGKPIPMTASSVDDSKVVALENSVQLPNFEASSADAEETATQPRLLVPERIEPPSVGARRRSKSSRGQGNQASATPKDEIPKFDEIQHEQVALHQRVRASTADRQVLSKFFALCLCVVAAINLGPAIYYWMEWSQEFESAALPRWIYLQVFVAAVHLVYAVFLIQVRDWTALKSVALVMLAVAFLFGLVSTGLIFGGGQGTVSKFLELPFSLVQRASMWCVAMLLLSTLICYMVGREAVNWQRTEQLIREIASPT